MTCKLTACTEKSTQATNVQPIIIGSIIGLGLLYLAFSHKRRK